MKTIQTAYKGYHFRSRLEARWAVFFDALGLKWEYEPEGFELPFVGSYLPDFRVISPQGHVQWYEIKPAHIKADAKFSAFSKEVSDGFWTHTDDKPSVIQSATLLSGDPCEWLLPAQLDPYCGIGACPRCRLLGDHEVYSGGSKGVDVLCHYCDADTPSGGGNPIEKGVFAMSQPHKGILMLSYGAWGCVLQKLVVAASKARSARFEHGESGATL